MRMPNVSRSLLQLQLVLRRSGTGALLAGALMLGAASMWFALLPGLSARVAEHAQALTRARSAPVAKPVVQAPALAAERLAAFYAALGDAGHTEEIVTRLFDAAADAGVVLEKAEYKPAHDAAGRFDTYTVILPVKGDYASLRRFCEKVLLSIPYAALDDMRFRRNSANDQAVEASLRFTVFLRPDLPGSVSARAAAPVSVSPALVSAPASAAAKATTVASELAGAMAPTPESVKALTPASVSAKASAPTSAATLASAWIPTQTQTPTPTHVTPVEVRR